MSSGYGVLVSIAGFYATTAADENLVFSSNFNQLKVKSSTTATITGSVTGAHGLSYVPVFFGSYSHDGNRFKMGQGGVDGTAILLDIYSTSGVNWRYYIFYHQAI